MKLGFVLFLTILFLLQSCQGGSDEIQRHRDLELEREEEYDTRKNPFRSEDEVKK
jgi:hypothetical protein